MGGGWVVVVVDDGRDGSRVLSVRVGRDGGLSGRDEVCGLG